MDFTSEIIKWYAVHKRDLPWRSSSDAYIIWLSEVILQQTRVEQGLPYFYRFKEAFPTVQDFASASEEQILKLWQGLGYYSRGRNMHATAKTVVEKYHGIFPVDYKELITLKGIGGYTAAAISSFAANQPNAVVDGNVFRLLSRYFGIETPINTGKGQKLFTELANQLIDPAQPGTFNQGIMEFGSLQCRPKNPLCETCPLRLNCVAFSEKRIDELPVKLKTQKIRERYFTYLVSRKDDTLLMHRRSGKDIWENLYQFPLIESDRLLTVDELSQNKELRSLFGTAIQFKQVYGPVKHLLSHQRLFAQFVEMEQVDSSDLPEGWEYHPAAEAESIPQPKLIFDFVKKYLN